MQMQSVSLAAQAAPVGPTHDSPPQHAGDPDCVHDWPLSAHDGGGADRSGLPLPPSCAGGGGGGGLGLTQVPEVVPGGTTHAYPVQQSAVVVQTPLEGTQLVLPQTRLPA